MRVAAVIPAAGYGSFRSGVPKVVETIEEGKNCPMVSETVRAVREGGADPIVVVTNPVFDAAIARALAASGADRVNWLTQPRRFGTLDAVVRGLVWVPPEIEAVVVSFADMPLWRAATIRGLIEAYRRERPAIAMVSISIADAGHPRVLERYGRILRNEKGVIVGVVEPGDATPELLAATTTVNPSLYVFNSRFFNENWYRVKPRDKGDGFEAELHLPPLVEIAARDGRRVIEVPLRDKREALGVNTPEELDEVRRVVAERKREEQLAATV